MNSSDEQTSILTPEASLHYEKIDEASRSRKLDGTEKTLNMRSRQTITRGFKSRSGTFSY